MSQYLTWAGVAVALLAAGWHASAWLYQRKITFLQLQMKVMRQSAVANTDQARRQIGQLQAELASRPTVAPDRFVVLEDGFAQTAVVGDAFAPTQMMR